VYRLLLRLLPGDFRGDFGREMEEVFREQHSEAERDGGRGLLRLWRDTIAGIFTTAPREHLSMFHQDARFALRMMRRNLGYTLTAVATLSLGIGATTAIFSIVHAVLLKPLPYANGERIVLLSEQAPSAGLSTTTFSVPEMNDIRSQNSSLDGLVEYHNMSFILLGRSEPERVETGVVSWNFFDVFGVKPLLGRDFTPEDEKEGSAAVLLLGYEYWQRSFGGDPTVVGRDFTMNDKIHTVVGVLPPFPQYPDRNDVYMPSVACPFRSNPALISSRNGRMISLFGRLKPTVTARKAEADLFERHRFDAAGVSGLLSVECPGVRGGSAAAGCADKRSAAHDSPSAVYNRGRFSLQPRLGRRAGSRSTGEPERQPERGGRPGNPRRVTPTQPERFDCRAVRRFVRPVDWGRFDAAKPDESSARRSRVSTGERAHDGYLPQLRKVHRWSEAKQLFRFPSRAGPGAATGDFGGRFRRCPAGPKRAKQRLVSD